MRSNLALLVAFMLILSGCVNKDNLDNYDGSKAASVTVSHNIQIRSIFPKTPLIAQGGSMTLSAVVTDSSLNELESTLADPVVVSWSSSDTSVATINERGIVYGKKLGKTTLTATARKGNEKSASVSVELVVVEQNSVDVAELYFAPMQAYLDLRSDRKFRLSAVDYSGTATSLSEGSVSFELSGDNITITPETIDLSPTNSEVEITARGQSKGFVFVTPIYSLPSKSGKSTVRITGTPLVVQVKDSVETSLPSSEMDAGHHLSIGVKEQGGKKEIKVTHYNADTNELMYSSFYGSWNHSISVPPSETGLASKMVLSPFASTLDQPIVVALQKNRATLWSKNNYGGWSRELISQADIVDDTNRYELNAKLMDIARYKPQDDQTQPKLHIAYYDAINSEVCIATFVNESTIETGSHQCMVTANSVHSISVDSNNLTGDIRLVYGTLREVVEDSDTNQTKTFRSELFYVARQSGGLYRELVASEDDLITADARRVSLKLDRNNRPIIALNDGVHPKLLLREFNSNKNSFVWTLLPIDGMPEVAKSISSIELEIDSYNEPRVVFAGDMSGKNSVMYARRPPFRNLGSRWVVEMPADSIDGDQGASSAIAVDSTDRAHIVYTRDDHKWFNYWAEPNFFDYRNYPVTNYVGADVIVGGKLP